MNIKTAFLLVAILTLLTACTDYSRRLPNLSNLKPVVLPNSNTNQSNNAANNGPAANPNGLPNLFKGEDYVQLRLKMTDAGWEPARSVEGELRCGEDKAKFCGRFPEFEGGGRSSFRWKRADKVVLIYTAGDPPYYDSYKFEKQPQPKTTLDHKPAPAEKTPAANSAKTPEANEPGNDDSETESN